MDTADEKVERRSAIARTHATARETLIRNYRKAKQDLEDAHLDDLTTNRQQLEAAYREEGLNPDGSDPQGNPQG